MREKHSDSERITVSHKETAGQIGTILLCASVLLSVGCVRRYSHFEGWLINSSTLMVSTKPSPTPDGSAHLLRNAGGNGLNVSVSQLEFGDLRSSSVVDSAVLEFVVSSTVALPPSPKLTVPAWISPRLRLEGVQVGPTGRDLYITLRADARGLDLVLSTLFSPRGVLGVVSSDDSSGAVSVEMRAAEPWFAWASVWSQPGKNQRKCVAVRSEVEYPVALDELTNGLNESQKIGVLLSPWQIRRIKLKDRLGDGAVRLALSKRLILTVPTGFTKDQPLFR